MALVPVLGLLVGFAALQTVSAKLSGSVPPCAVARRGFADLSVTSSLPNGAFVATARDCQNTCAATPTCANWTWQQHRSTVFVKGACYLFASGRQVEVQAGAISGPPRCPGEHRFGIPFNMTVEYPSSTWGTTRNGTNFSKAKELMKGNYKQFKGHISDSMGRMKNQVMDTEVCAGPRCCQSSSCHTIVPTMGCYTYRGPTACVGDGLLPPKFGKCMCQHGACDKRGVCPAEKEGSYRNHQGGGAPAA
eukprot:CAMPEP_0168403030 /NCGR_PEP_ID=MMETSP0228-20121227/23920_1 /TAXON_ID=133427 /ORGANISM="Protoceratium reticulatum, Strain CCCM 535 (=CCMP 1889)" /LENGTH=247 /DNA_ID=CAMNT_0008416623 /DNA_START=65 /DNA_END=805 /DNA_ORIENTATION=+